MLVTSDLLWASQVQGVAAKAGWPVLRLEGAPPALPPDGVRGDVLVLDLARESERALSVLDACLGPQCPWEVLACYPHVDVGVRQEAMRRGVTHAWPRSQFLARLAESLARGPTSSNAAPKTRPSIDP